MRKLRRKEQAREEAAREAERAASRSAYAARRADEVVDARILELSPWHVAEREIAARMHNPRAVIAMLFGLVGALGVPNDCDRGRW